jgi:hypothetical protein
MLQALIIVFREGFESFLTVAIIFAYLKKTGRDWLRPAVWWGIGAAVVASAALGFWLRSVTNQPLWEGIVALVAAVLVASFVIHIWRVAPTMKREMEAKIEARASNTSTGWAGWGVHPGLLMIAREGAETALLVRYGGAASDGCRSDRWPPRCRRLGALRTSSTSALFRALFPCCSSRFRSCSTPCMILQAEVLPNSEPFTGRGLLRGRALQSLDHVGWGDGVLRALARGRDSWRSQRLA